MFDFRDYKNEIDNIITSKVEDVANDLKYSVTDMFCYFADDFEDVLRDVDDVAYEHGCGELWCRIKEYIMAGGKITKELVEQEDYTMFTIDSIYKAKMDELTEKKAEQEADEEAELLNQIVDSMIYIGTNHSLSGNYHISFNELAEMWDDKVDYDWVVAHSDDILYELHMREETLEEQFFDYDKDGNKKGFDMLFGLAYCPNAEDEDGDVE